MASVHRRPAARGDLIAHAVYLAENAGEATAERFLDNADSSFEAMAAQPMIGAPLTLRHSELAGLRKWRVEGFENFLIFYLARPNFEKQMVLHARRLMRVRSVRCLRSICCVFCFPKKCFSTSR